MTATATDNVGVARVAFFIDGVLSTALTTQPYAFNWDTTAVADGKHTLQAKGYDPAGNVGASATVSVSVLNSHPDLMPPSVSLSSPTAGATVSASVPVGASASDNVGVSRVDFLVDGAVKDSDTSAPYGFSWSTAAIADGSHTLQARAYDPAGNAGASSPVSVSVLNTSPDLVPPSVTLGSPTAGATVSGSVPVGASASDDVGVSRVDFLVDGAISGTDTTSPYGFSWDTTAVADGSHTLQAKAYDSSGNAGASATLSVMVGNSVSPNCSGVPVAVGADLQTAINGNPSGTSFCIKSGVHRVATQITLKSNDTLQGEAGAILDGSKEIGSQFVQSGSKWVASGQSQSLTSATSVPCESSKPLCQQADDVYFDDRPLNRVGSLAAVVPGTFYFDHANQQVWLGENPTGHRVDATVTNRAIVGWGTGVDHILVRNLIVQHFASQGIQCRGNDWRIDHSEIRYNHGDGLQDCPVVTYSNLHDNGKDGYVFGGSIGTTVGPYTFDHNSVTGNNYAGYDPNWEAGGAKFMQMSNLTVSNNYVADNEGNGLWTDWGNQYITYEGNDIERNSEAGIFHEASYDAVIRNNTLVGNGTAGGSSTLVNSGISMNDSQNVEIYGNSLSGNHNGIGMTQTDRGSTSIGPLVTQNDYIHDNTILKSGRSGLVEWVSDGSYYTSRNNRFVHNTYDLGCDGTPFIWQSPTNSSSYTALSAIAWRAAGEDVTGTFSATCP